MTILVTGAAGRTSSFVIRALLDSKPTPNLRLLVHSTAAAESVQRDYNISATAVVVGDYLEKSTLRSAFQDVDLIFHNGPVFDSQETAMGIALIDKAKEAGVKHFVYCSVLFPLLTKLLNHEVKLRVEEYLIESGLNYTILEPTVFMQNIDVLSVIDSGKLPCAYSPEVLQGFVDLQDLALITRDIILHPEPHNRARYELVGVNLTLEEVAKTISNESGRSITCKTVPREQAVARSVSSVGSQGHYATEALDRMLYYYDQRGIPGNSNTLRWLLGRSPTSWGDLVRRELQQ